jgi:hypothetical protein
LLEDVTHPKPLKELLDATFEQYASTQPWVADFEVKPKTVVRDLYERAMSFAQFVSHYSLARSEGLVLRYLSDAFRALRQTVPEEAKSEELIDLIEWLGELVRQVDSSLLDEWEQLINPTTPQEGPVLPPPPPSVVANPRAFRVLVRNELFRRVQLAALDKVEDLVALDPGFDWDAALEGYYAEYDEIGTAASARSATLLTLDEGAFVWTARQVFEDPAGDHDWGISATIDLEASVELGAPAITVTAVGPVSS